MGLSSSKKKSTTKPVYEKQVIGAYNTLSNAYNDQAPKVQEYADQVGSLVPSLLDKYRQGDAGVNAAKGYVTDTLAGRGLYEYTPDAYLTSVRDGRDGSNTSLDAMIAMTNNSVANGLNAKLGTRGLTGGTVQQSLLAKALAENETGLRYQDYTTQQQRRDQAGYTEAQRRDQAAQIGLQQRENAAGMAPGLSAADMASIAPLLSATQLAAGLPLDAASQFAGNVGGLLGQYGTTTQKSSGSILDSIGKVAQIGGTLASFSDARLKENVRRVGSTDAGLPIYVYNYKGESTPVMGVMAQEVAALQPEALGPVVGGFGTVLYGEVR